MLLDVTIKFVASRMAGSDRIMALNKHTLLERMKYEYLWVVADRSYDQSVVVVRE